MTDAEIIARAIKKAIIYDCVMAFHSLVRTHADSQESVALYKAMHAMPDKELSALNDIFAEGIANIASRTIEPTLTEAGLAIVPVKSERLLARQQPCGCLVCICEDDEQCRGCGAKVCATQDCVLKGDRSRAVYEEIQ